VDTATQLHFRQCWLEVNNLLVYSSGHWPLDQVEGPIETCRQLIRDHPRIRHRRVAGGGKLDAIVPILVGHCHALRGRFHDAMDMFGEAERACEDLAQWDEGSQPLCLVYKALFYQLTHEFAKLNVVVERFSLIECDDYWRVYLDALTLFLQCLDIDVEPQQADAAIAELVYLARMGVQGGSVMQPLHLLGCASDAVHFNPTVVKEETVTLAIDLAAELTERLSGACKSTAHRLHGQLLWCAGRTELAETMLQKAVGEAEAIQAHGLTYAAAVAHAELLQRTEATGRVREVLEPVSGRVVRVEGGEELNILTQGDDLLSISFRTRMKLAPLTDFDRGNSSDSLQSTGSPPRHKISPFLRARAHSLMNELDEPRSPNSPRTPTSGSPSRHPSIARFSYL